MPWGPNENPGMNCELNGLIATLSTGPFGIADKAGDTNKTLVMRSIRKDGLILQPDRPATYVDAMFLQELGSARPKLQGAVWTTSASVPQSSGGDVAWLYALSIDVTAKWQLSQADFFPRVEASSGWVARRWHQGHMPTACTAGSLAVGSGCLLSGAIRNDRAMPDVFNDRPIMVQNDTHVFDLIQMAPIAENGWVLLGELNKYVSVSRKRFSKVQFVPSGIVVEVNGTAGEEVTVSALQPGGADMQDDWRITEKKVVFADSQTKSVSFSSEGSTASVPAIAWI